MKLTHLLPALLGACVIYTSANSAVITGFGPANVTAPWSYDGSSSTLTGTNGPGGTLTQSGLSVPIGLNTKISITANSAFGLQSNDGFTVTLFDDTGGETATATFRFGSFSGGATVVNDLNVSQGFGGNIQAWQFTSGGTPVSPPSINTQFSSMSIVPEPSTIGLLLIGGGLSAFAMGRRRRHRA